MSADRRRDLGLLPDAEQWVVKPMLGADSIGLQVPDSLDGVELEGALVQPRIDIVHEISFVLVGRRLQYALYAPDRARRWALVPYAHTDADLVFAQRFVNWNTLDVGVQRVDACRTHDGALLLVEPEDLNPYLSLDLIDTATRSAFTGALTASLQEALDRFPRSKAGRAEGTVAHREAPVSPVPGGPRRDIVRGGGRLPGGPMLEARDGWR